jgi:phospholipase A-2-activating protein
VELNGTVASAGGAPLSEPELASLRTLVDALEETRYYHSKKAPATGISVLLRTLAWPPSHAFPSLDLLRVLLTHADGNAALAAAPAQFMPAVLAAAAAGDAAARPAALMAGRALLNLCALAPTQGVFVRELPAVLGAVGALLRFPHASVQATGAWVLHNAAHAAVEAAGGLAALGAAPLPPFLAGGALQQAMALIKVALGLADEDARVKALIAAGSLAAIDAAAGKVALAEARAAGIKEAAAAAAAGSAAAAPIAAEVARILDM